MPIFFPGRNLNTAGKGSNPTTMTQKKVSAITSVYKGEKYLAAFLANCSGQTIKNSLEIVLVHNQPSDKETEIVKQFQNQHPGLLNHIVVAREPLAISTNRAIKAAAGEYVCIWNVDDLRTPDSLEIMARTLDSNPKAGFTYGDYIIVRQWESKNGRLITEPEFEKKIFIQGMHLGPFYMWRKSLCEKLGYWDEQFKSGADFDYAARLALEAAGKKTNGLLGYYLDEGLGLSTGKTPWQPIERTTIELRFGVYKKLDFWYYNRAKKYRVNNILLDGQWYAVEHFAPSIQAATQSKFFVLYAIIRYPFWVLKRIYNKVARSLI